MSNTLKTVISVGALVVVAAVLYFGMQWYQGGKNADGSAVFSDEPAVLPSGAASNDDSLTKDTAAIDAQLKGLDADTTSAQASLSESAGAQ